MFFPHPLFLPKKRLPDAAYRCGVASEGSGGAAYRYGSIPEGLAGVMQGCVVTYN